MQPSPSELSRAAGISQSYASMLLSDDMLKRRAPSLRMALKIFDRTGLQLGALKGLQPAEIDTLRKVAA